MSSARGYCSIVLLLFSVVFHLTTLAQNQPDWIIQPEQINIEVDNDRTLQVLDVNLQELRGAQWAVDDPEKADLVEDGARVVLHAKRPGTVLVTAALNGEMKRREVTIWEKIENGTTRWSTRPIGRHIKNLPAVPGDGPHLYSLEQRPDGHLSSCFGAGRNSEVGLANAGRESGCGTDMR